MSDIKDSKVDVAAVEPDVEPEPAKVEYIEFVGMEPYGTEFYKGEHGTHTVSRAHLKEHHDLTAKKDLVWRKDAKGRMLLKADEMSPEVAELLSNDPMFKRVTL